MPWKFLITSRKGFSLGNNKPLDGIAPFWRSYSFWWPRSWDRLYFRLRIRESQSLEKTFKIIYSKHQLITTIPAKPCIWVPHLNISCTLPGTMTPPLPWAACSNALPLFQRRNVPDIQADPPLVQLEAVIFHQAWLSICYSCNFFFSFFALIKGWGPIWAEQSPALCVCTKHCQYLTGVCQLLWDTVSVPLSVSPAVTGILVSWLSF